MEEDKVIDFQNEVPDAHGMVDGYLESAAQGLQKIAEMSMRLEQVVVKDGQINSMVAEATRAARQRSREAYHWLCDAATIVNTILDTVEQKENNDG